MNEKINAVIFDMGGVLLRTINSEPREAIAERFGVTRAELEAFVFTSETSFRSEIGEISDKEHWENVLAHFNRPEDDTLKIYDEYFSGDTIDQDLLAFAVSLKENYRLGLLSNAWKNARSMLVRHFEFLNVFDVSVFSYEVGMRKPDPMIFKMILEKMGINPENALFIDDMQNNVAGAKSVGLHTIRYIDTPTTIAAAKAILE
ncbi:MAG: HAD family phosphatase [Anaerolineaceae bacterium]|nr:HAD family phosphatase [Anaerolineaceae bacterium]